MSSYLLVAFPLGGSVRIVQSFEDGVLTELLLYLQHGFLAAAFLGQHFLFGFLFFTYMAYRTLSRSMVVGNKRVRVKR